MGQQKVADKTKVEELLEEGIEEPKKKEERKPKKGRKKKGPSPMIRSGHVYIQSTYNNTIITVTDLRGNTLVWSSAGSLGFKGPRKSTPYAAGITAKNVAEKVKVFGLREADVFIRGIGPGRESAIRTLGTSGIDVASIKDVTSTPHNGCRPPKPRRI